MADLEAVRGRARVIAIKSAWRRVPFADVLYGLDRGWWIANKGVPEFAGLKVSPAPTACTMYGLRRVTLKPVANIVSGPVGVLGCGLRIGGGHSGFQAINLAVQFGARRIVLMGFDMTLARGSHWTDDMRGVAKPDAKRIEGWRIAMDDAAPQFVRLGVEVINATPGSALTAYRFMPLREAVMG